MIVRDCILVQFISSYIERYDSQVVSVLDSGTEGKLLTPIMPLFTKQQNW